MAALVLRYLLMPEDLSYFSFAVVGPVVFGGSFRFSAVAYGDIVTNIKTNVRVALSF